MNVHYMCIIFSYDLSERTRPLTKIEDRKMVTSKCFSFQTGRLLFCQSPHANSQSPLKFYYYYCTLYEPHTRVVFTAVYKKRVTYHCVCYSVVKTYESI